MRLLVASRLVLGTACGATTVVVPVYLGELAPPRLRGAFGTFTQLSMVVGILAADLVALGGGAASLFAASFIAALLMLLAAAVLPLVPSPSAALEEDDRLRRAEAVIDEDASSAAARL
jgi:SP family facilitated glucose transporter-like MFS transporter 3